jgi:hypothetical protein
MTDRVTREMRACVSLRHGETAAVDLAHWSPCDASLASNSIAMTMVTSGRDREGQSGQAKSMATFPRRSTRAPRVAGILMRAALAHWCPLRPPLLRILPWRQWLNPGWGHEAPVRIGEIDGNFSAPVEARAERAGILMRAALAHWLPFEASLASNSIVVTMA